jgi:hypothetical protein
MRKARLNNLSMSYQRREPVYEAVLTDLALMGIITREQCEALTGTKIGETTRLPEVFYENESTEL